MISLYSPKTVTEILGRHELAPLKKLGQNFLIDENIVNKIAEAASDGGNILEIGPGMGALTRALAKYSKKVVAVEIDAGMIRVQQETLADLDNVTVLHADVLKTDIKAVGEEYFGGEPFCVAGNLPYYITAKCILQVLDSGAPVKRFTAMVQKEVADRLASMPGDSDYGALTASVAYYGDMEFLFPRVVFIRVLMLNLQLCRSIRRHSFLLIARLIQKQFVCSLQCAERPCRTTSKTDLA
ncbi:MAG: methyltransferase domain-containing protein [Christensenellaceae bacterium]|nr:methyltransferase domain-containing protein [Christensenellaceae bacterium]